MVSTPQHRSSTTGNVDQQPLLYSQAPYLTSQVGVGGEPDYILDSQTQEQLRLIILKEL